MMATRIRRSPGNVFRDLGFSRTQAANLLIRADLMIDICKIIRERGLTQEQAAKVLGVSQPRVSDLMRYRMALFSIDSLVEFLARLGYEVKLQTKRSRHVA